MTLPLENNINIAVKKIAAQRIRANKGKNAFIISAIVLTTVLFAAVFAVAGGFLDQWKQIQRQQYGAAHGGIKFLTQQQYEILAASDRKKEIFYTRVVGMAENEELAKLDTEVRYAQDGSAKSFLCYPSTGRMPEQENEIATSTLVLDALGVPCELGASVPLTISVDGEKYRKDFTLCGFWKGYERAGAQEAWVSEICADSIAPAAQQPLAESGRYGGIFCADIYFDSEWNVMEQMNALLEDAGKESGIYMLPISTNPSCGLGISPEQLDPAFFLAAAVLLAIIGFVGYLIIYNMFVISVTQDIQFFGLLRTIGASGKQIRGIVRRQAFRLAVLGMPPGLAAGYLVGRLFLPYVLTQIDIDQTGVYRINPLVLLGAVFFSLLTVWISSLKPCRYAAKISAMEAVRYVDGDSMAQRQGGRTGTKRKRRITPWTMAAGNLRRSRKQAVFVVLSIALGMILLNATYTAVSGFDMETYIEKYAVADFYITDYSVLSVGRVGQKNLEGISVRLLEEINERDGLENHINLYGKEIVHTMPDHIRERVGQMTGSDAPGIQGMRELMEQLEMYGYTGTIVYGMDAAALKYVTLEQGTVDEALWESGRGVIVDDFFYHGAAGVPGQSPLYRPGEEIQLTDTEGVERVCTVTAVGGLRYDAGTHYDLDLGLNIILPLKRYQEIFGETQPLCTMFDVEDAHREETEEWIERYCTQTEKNMSYISYRTYEKDFQKEKAAYSVIGGVLSGILALIGLLNFMNVTITSLLARQKEMAVLGAAGMEQRQIRRMLAFEGMAYIGLAALFSATAGTWICYFLCTKLAGNRWAFRYHFTLLPVLLCLPFLLGAAVAVPLMFYRRIRKKSIVERLRSH